MESTILAILDKVLAPYVNPSDLKREKLRVGVWSGNVSLSDLSLRSDALDSLELPLELLRGCIGRLHLRVPWTRLRSEPVEIVLEDVVIIARLREKPDADAFLRRERLRKRLGLDAAELLRGLHERAGDAGQSAPRDSFLGRLGRAVLDNLRVKLLRVHVRCEQAGIDGEERCAWGATLESFEMSSTDSAGQPEYQSPLSSEPWLHKMFTLAAIRIYWEPLASQSHADGMPWERVATGSAEVSTVLAPTDAALHFRMLRTGMRGDPRDPRTACTCRITQRVDMELSSRQCVLLLQVCILFDHPHA